MTDLEPLWLILLVIGCVVGGVCINYAISWTFEDFLPAVWRIIARELREHKHE